MTTANREGAAPVVPSVRTVLTLDWAAVRKAVRCQRDQRDRDDVIEYKRPGECLFVEDRLPWLIAEEEGYE